MLGSKYPVRFDVDYPDRDLNRLTTAFRLLWIIPIAIIAALISHYGHRRRRRDRLRDRGRILVAPTVLMILFREKYPRWWFDWNLELSRFLARVAVYMGLMNDEYPSTDDQQTVHLDIDYPNVEKDLGRGMPLIKWLLAIPHWIILAVLYFVAFFAVIGAWFAILFTGRYPRSIFDFVVGVHRWGLRVEGYAVLMVTDEPTPTRSQPRSPRRPRPHEGPPAGGRGLYAEPMVLKRVIPCLDVDAGRVVKGTNFVDIRDAGDPVELAERYDAEGADELVFLDITASSDQRDTIVELARRTADNVFIPFTIGGGIRSVEDAQAVLDAGADKVSVNSAALARPELISELAEVFGSQCVVVAIDAKRENDGWGVYVEGRSREGRGPRGNRLGKGGRGARARGRSC